MSWGRLAFRVGPVIAMSTKILIITQAGDAHAYAVAEALKRKGAEVLLWHTSDFPMLGGESLHFDGCGRRIEVTGPGSFLYNSLCPVNVVWRRRPSFILEKTKLHPADRKFAELECGSFRRSLLANLEPAAFWVNSPDGALKASNKILQHSVAMDVGLATPDTLYSNDPTEIRRFIQRNGGQVVYKPFNGVTWRNNTNSWASYTAILTESALVDDSLLRLTPGIFQAVMPKKSELRVAVMGRQIVAVKLYSQETAKGRLDWRKAYDELTMEVCQLSGELAAKCIEIMQQLGIVFGCFDFIVTPAGNHVFLEVNEAGQFLFVEDYTGFPLLDIFSDFLLQGSPDFQWENRDPRVRYSEVKESVKNLAKEAEGIHVAVSDTSIWDDCD